MVESSVNIKEYVINDEEPLPEEYKEQKIENVINNTKNGNIIISPQENNISKVNKEVNIIKIPNSNQLLNKNHVLNNQKKTTQKKVEEKNNIVINEKKSQNKNNNSNVYSHKHNISISGVSKAKTTFPHFEPSKFENYDVEKILYSVIKDYSYLHIDKDEEFLNRMQFDVYKRQLKEDRLNKLIVIK